MTGAFGFSKRNALRNLHYHRLNGLDPHPHPRAPIRHQGRVPVELLQATRPSAHLGRARLVISRMKEQTTYPNARPSKNTPDDSKDDVAHEH